MTTQRVVALRPRSVEALERYVERLARCRTRLDDDLQAATLRIEWARHESRTRGELHADHIRLLTEAGVLSDPALLREDHRIIERRRAQLEAIAEVERLTLDSLAAASSRRPRTGATMGT